MFQSSCTAISMQQLLSLTWRNGNNQEFTSRQRTFYSHSPLAYMHTTTTRKMVQAQHHLKKRPRTPNTVAQNGGKVFTTARERISAQGRMPNKWTACCIHRVPVPRALHCHCPPLVPQDSIFHVHIMHITSHKIHVYMHMLSGQKLSSSQNCAF